jgi:hypothetical protein
LYTPLVYYAVGLGWVVVVDVSIEVGVEGMVNLQA